MEEVLRMPLRTSPASRSASTAPSRFAQPRGVCGRRDSWRPWTVAWLGACGLAFGNAIIRQAIYERHVGDLRAHQISTATLLGIFAVYVWMLQRRWPIETNQAALAVGAIWAMLTLAFEFGFGHWVVGQSWAELLEAYNLGDGRVWVLVPLWTLIAPATIRALQQPRRS
jgi:hypothetical protein